MGIFLKTFAFGGGIKTVFLLSVKKTEVVKKGEGGSQFF